MRSFIAIDIPAEIKSAIGDIVRKTGGSCGIRWVPESNMHLTLKFLGEVKEDLVSAIEQRLRAAAAHQRLFSIGIRGAGAFPNLRRPSVLWVGFEASARLKALFDDMETGLAELGIAKEDRPFSPHLTIGRVKELKGIEPVVRELSTYKDTFFGTIDVREILFMKSVLNPAGAEYSKVAVIKLNKE
jgi:2'-5' RNA ligase